MAKTSASLAASGTPSSSVGLIGTPGSRARSSAIKVRLRVPPPATMSSAGWNGRSAAATVSAVATVNDASRSSAEISSPSRRWVT
jgi:hypothetical protein